MYKKIDEEIDDGKEVNILMKKYKSKIHIVNSKSGFHPGILDI